MGSNKVLQIDAEYDIPTCRKEVGLRALVARQCTCLRCGGGFLSEGNHNRICELCKVDFASLPCGIADYMIIDYRSDTRYERLYRKKRKEGQNVRT